MVSVYCTAYNHQDYIRKCLEGFVNQKTNFAFEIIVNDDLSTDGTADIIREFEEKYPDIMRPIYQTENQYSQNISIFFNHFLPRAKGKYFAICEGDDYWTDEYKLQKQFDAMEAHPDINICAHAVKQINVRTNKTIAIIAPRKKSTVIPAEDVIFGGGGFVGTNSLFLRTDVYRNAPDFFKEFAYDYTFQILGSLGGGMLYISDCMSVYNYLTAGSYSERREKQAKEMAKKFNEGCIKMLNSMNEYTGGRYGKAIEETLLLREMSVLAEEHRFKELKDPKYRSVYKKLPFSKRAKMRIKAMSPALTRFVRKYIRKGGSR